MSDIIDEIDRLHAEATQGEWQPTCDDDESDDPNGIVVSGIRIAEFVGEDEIRRRKAKGRIERPGSSFGPDSLDEVDANARLTAALRNAWPALRDRLVAAERKARALQTLANSAVICEACEALRCWEPHVRVLGNVNAGDLLTAIEAATWEAKP